MSAPRGQPGPGQNRLFSILPPGSRERLGALALPVRLAERQLLMHTGDPIEHVYFPRRGVVSLIVLMQDGRGVEAASIGFEGMVGAPLLLGEEFIPYEATVQVAGDALRIGATDFRKVLEEDEGLRKVLLRYVQVLMVYSLRSAACNRLHEVEERLARWLLHTHDWVWEDSFRLTQDFLAATLGVRRPTVTIAAGTLQRAGLITYRRGEITILDRPGLEDVACEDYEAVRTVIERLLAPQPDRS